MELEENSLLQSSVTSQETAEAGDEPFDFEMFKNSLHTMVLNIEELGGSALPALLQMRGEFRAKQSDLMRQSSAVERKLREVSYGDQNAMQELVRFQKEQIFVYHQSVWLEGYIRDRL